MNVYDFDKTIYDGDSSIDFFVYAIRHKPSVVRYLPRQIYGFMLYALKKIGKTELKEYFFSFLSAIDANALSLLFWKEKRNKIFSWYLNQRTDEDIIISASPEFLLKPICEELKVGHLIASKVDPLSGRFKGENCKGEEKVKRLREEKGITEIDNFYSDSLSDLPLAKIAGKAFLIKEGTPSEWRNTPSC